MSQNLIDELKQIIKGEVLSDDNSLEHYSTDGSIFQLKPWAVILPSSKQDIINTVKWIEQKKRDFFLNAKPYTLNPNFLSVTCRGKGTDQAGGPLNEGIIIRFPEHLDKILEVGDDFVRLEPGAIWSDVNQKLTEKQNRLIPCYPASQNFSTMGGGIANNCSGEKTVKYGSMREQLISVKMILADSAETEFKKMPEETVKQKQTQNNREGEIYRRLSDLLVSNHNLIQNSKPSVSKNASGYWLYDVLGEDGSLDLARLVCGSQGTLGVITEAAVKTIPKPPFTGLLLASFANLKKAGESVPKLLSLKPSALEMIDAFLIGMIKSQQPEMVQSLTEQGKIPALVLFIEFDGETAEEIKNKISRAKSIIADLTENLKEAYETKEQNNLWQARRSAAVIAEAGKGNKRALPFIEDTAVSPEQMPEYLNSLYRIMKKRRLEFSVWGHAGDGNVHIQPFLNLADQTDVKAVFSVAEEVYALAVSLGGVISAEHNDGLMRSPFLEKQFGKKMCRLFGEVKNAFDPQNIFNPGKKIGTDIAFLKSHLRKEYNVEI